MSDPYAAFPDVQPVAPAGPQADPYAGYADVRLPPPMKPAPQPGVLEDAWSGATQPFVNLGHDVMQNYRSTVARAQQPLPSLPQAAGQALGDLASTGKIVGDALSAIPGAIQGAVVRPLARAVGNVAPTPYQAPQLSMAGGRPVLSAPRALTGDAAQAATENMINTALMGARPATARPMVAGPTPKTLDQLQAAKTARYGDVKALGGAYTDAAKNSLLTDIETTLANDGLDAAAHPGATAALKNAKRVLSAPGPVDLDALDKVRQVAWRDAAGLTDPNRAGDKHFGQKIIDAIDDFISNAPPSSTTGADPKKLAGAIDAARAANQAYRKVQTVSNELTSADLRSSSTYAGGNKANAIRQELRPLLDPTSGRQMRGLTPDEAAQLNRVVKGSPAQNGVRLVGKAFDPRSLLGATVNALVAGATGGHGQFLSSPVGMVASELSNGMTLKEAKKLTDLMSMGGVRPPAPPMATPVPVSRLVSPSGLTGVGVVSAPLARLPAAPEPRSRPMKKAAPQGR